MLKKVRVWTGLKLFPIAEYEISENIQIGQIVKIPFRKKEILGVVIEIIKESKYQLKLAQCSSFSLSQNYMKFLNHSSLLTLHNMQQIITANIKMFSDQIKEHMFEKGNYIKSNFNLEQQNAIEIIKTKKNSIFLLWGVTGSGKTEVFFEIINEKIQENKQVLIILPEIAITEGIKERFFKKFGFYPVIWNSKCKNKTNFTNISNGNVSVVIGSRCSIFLPFKNLDLIIVDEEHDSSYKQTTSPIYNCRDLAVLRGKIKNITVILASATPSLESFYNYKQGKYELIRLKTRHKALPLPKVTFQINQESELLSSYAIKRIIEEIEKKQQIIIFLNRRGFGPIVTCKQCFNRLYCKKCQNMLNFHIIKKILLCHKCNEKYEHNHCFICDSSNSLTSFGLGIEKVHDYLIKKFPDFMIEIISSDTCDSIHKISEFIEKMKNKSIQIVVGTQILAKGHNFPDISLVIILGSHNSFFNFRANEAIFQTLIQVAGRAGRNEDNAEVILENDKNIDSELLKFFKNQDYESFLHFEMKEREKWNLTPFARIIAIKFSHKSEQICLNTLNSIKNDLTQFNCINISSSIFIKFYKNQYFYQIIARISRENFIKNAGLIKNIIPDSCIVDVDPINLMS